MKAFFLFPVIISFWYSNKSNLGYSTIFQIDTTKIIHLTDGNISEWPTDKFMVDKETKMEYAVDNDNQTLFLAISISDKRTQKSVMMEGLNLYIDVKGKKKKNKGIEFPAKIENMASVEKMKLFGFSDGEPFLQDIHTEGTANMALTWDSVFVLHIEYRIPLKMLEETLADLNNKKISIGWELKGGEMPGTSYETVTVTTRAVPSGSRRPSGNNNSLSNVNNNPAIQTGSNRSQSFWVLHIISF